MIFKDFPGPGIFKKKNGGLSRRRGNPVIANISMTIRRIISKIRCFIEIRCLFMLLNDN